MIRRTLLILIAISFYSCSVNRSLHTPNNRGIGSIDSMFFKQASHNENVIINYLYKLDTMERYNYDFTSFKVMYSLDRLRKIKHKEIYKLISQTNTLLAIEYYNDQTYYVHYWNDENSQSFILKNLRSNVRVVETYNLKIPDLEYIKQRMEGNIPIDEVLEKFKKAYHNEYNNSGFIISKYKFENGKIKESLFSILQ